ncbi:Receptor family ligand binding region [Mycobacterium tuberculosis]|nr:Receptor family ligand binding region [Mycobacterium tuberculosis]
MPDGSSVRIGALVPLTRPGWVAAGRHLLAGLELAVREVNDTGGGRPLELVVRDKAADPRRAAAAVEELAGLGVAALAGEYHSVVARAAAAKADALGLPFLCSSAVLDALTQQPTECAVPRRAGGRHPQTRAGCVDLRRVVVMSASEATTRRRSTSGGLQGAGRRAVRSGSPRLELGRLNGG